MVRPSCWSKFEAWLRGGEYERLGTFPQQPFQRQHCRGGCVGPVGEGQPIFFSVSSASI